MRRAVQLTLREVMEFLLAFYEFRRRIFFGRGADSGFDVFAGVFEGCFEEHGFLVMVF